MKGDRFWQRADQIEADFTGDGDQPRFVRRMKRLGFDDEVIADRIQAVEELKGYSLSKGARS